MKILFPRAVQSFVLALSFLASAAYGAEFIAHKVTAPNGKQSLLVGTMHQAYPGVTQPTPAIFDGVKTYVIEHTTFDEKRDTTNAPEVVAAAAAGKNITAPWAGMVTKEHQDRILHNVRCALPVFPTRGLLDAMKRERPGDVLGLAWIPCVSPRLKSRDDWFVSEWLNRDIARETLESQDEVEPQRRALPKSMLIHGLQLALSADLNKVYTDVTALLNAANYEAILTKMTEGATAEEAELFIRIMVTERNQLWLPRLKGYLDMGDALVVVGAAHYAGPTGLFALLSADGYLIEKVALPPGPEMTPVPDVTLQ